MYHSTQKLFPSVPIHGQLWPRALYMSPTCSDWLSSCFQTECHAQAKKGPLFDVPAYFVFGPRTIDLGIINCSTIDPSTVDLNIIEPNYITTYFVLKM